VIVAAALVAGGALALALRVALARERAPRLPAADPDPPPVAVLLPVRDEEDNVEACLAALAAQTAPVTIRVLDDGSRDRTARLAGRFAASDARVEVRAVPPPPAGVNGKIHALARGSRDLEADWILAVDADARPAPAALARALAAARLHGLAAVSLAARQRTRGPGEGLLTPLVFAWLDLRLGDWSRAAIGRGGPVANGQFLLVRRDALEAVGGYAALLHDPLDDVALAWRLTADGGRVGFWRAGDLLEVRMYRGGRATFLGWRRNLALLVGDRPAEACALALAALLPAATALAAAASGSIPATVVAWAGAVAASLVVRSESGASAFWGLLYPVDALIFAGCVAAAATDRRRRRLRAWRGRPVAEPDQPPMKDKLAE